MKSAKKLLEAPELPLSKDRALRIMTRMLRVRIVEEMLADEYAKQEMKCPLHLYIGQEAVAAGVSEALTLKDQMVSTHRSHGHYLAQFGDLNAMVAELYGRETGCAGGKGGSMHLLDTSVGYMGSSAIVGGSIPLATGLAFAIQYRGEARVAVSYMGDGAVEEGVFYECLNFAALKKLPLLFVCENNGMATLTPLEQRQPNVPIVERARGFGIPATQVDGNDVAAVYHAAADAVRRARLGEGPSFIEAKTYRWRAHCGPQWDAVQPVRPKAELEAWMQRCPIQSLSKRLQSEHGVSETELAAMKDKVAAETREAIVLAKASAFPKAVKLEEDVLA